MAGQGGCRICGEVGHRVVNCPKLDEAKTKISH
jgi:hypothetical protein